MSAELQPYEEVLRDLYIVQDKGLKDVMMYMRDHHEINSSKNQYERQFKHWKFRKHLSKDEWHFVHHRVEKRKREGKDSEIYFQGALIPAKKIKKETSRNVPVAQGYYTSAKPKTPQDLYIRTPVSTSNTFPRKGSFHMNLPWNRFSLHFESQGMASSFRYKSSQNTLNQTSIMAMTLNSDNMNYSIFRRFVSERESFAFRISNTATNAINSRLRAIMVGSYDREIPEIVTALTGSRGTSTVLCLIKLAVYQVSNNLLQAYEVTKLLTRIIDSDGQSILLSLCCGNSPAYDAFTISIFKAAMQIQEKNLVKELLDQLIVRKYVQHSERVLRLITGFRHGNIDIINMLIKAGSKIEDGRSILNLAIDNDRVDIALALLNSGAPLHSRKYKNDEGGIHIAKSIEMLHVLLEAGTDISRIYDNKCFISYKERCLQYHLYHGNAEMVQHLFEIGAVVNAITNYEQNEIVCTSLISAVSRGDTHKIVTLLIDHGADVNLTRSDGTCKTALAEAVTGGSLEIVEILIRHGADTNISSFWGTTKLPRSCLLEAVELKDLNIVECLLNAGADVNAPAFGEYGSTAYEAAVALGVKSEITTLLLKFGASTEGHGNAIQKKTELKFYQCVIAGDCQGARELLQAGADVNKMSSKYECTALIEATWSADINMILLLLEFGADVNAQCGSESPLSVALISQNIWLIEMLVRFGADIHGHLFWPIDLLFKAKARECGICWEHFLYSKIDSKISCLGLAIWISNPSLIEFLLEEGQDVRESVRNVSSTSRHPSKNRGQSMHIQCLFSRSSGIEESLSILSSLLKYGASVMQLWTDIICLAMFEYRNSDPFYSVSNNSNGFKPLFSNLLILVLQVLLSNGANINKSTSLGGLFFHKALDDQFDRISMFGAAAFYGSQEIALFLLQNGADIHHDEQLVELAFAGTAPFEMIKLLIEHKAPVNSDYQGLRKRTALQRAASAESGDFDLVKDLLDAGADVNAPPAKKSGITALQGAAIQGHVGIASLLLEKGAEVSMSGAEECGRTALEGAAENGRLDMVQLLLNAGADSNLPEEDRYITPIAYADKEDHFAVVELLKSYQVCDQDILDLKVKLCRDQIKYKSWYVGIGG